MHIKHDQNVGAHGHANVNDQIRAAADTGKSRYAIAHVRKQDHIGSKRNQEEGNDFENDAQGALPQDSQQQQQENQHQDDLNEHGSLSLEHSAEDQIGQEIGRASC